MKEAVHGSKNMPLWLDRPDRPPTAPSLSGKVESELAIVGAEKILFGTDYPLLTAQRYFDEIHAAGLEKTSLDKILGRNTATLFGLEEM